MKHLPESWKIQKLGEAFIVKDGTHNSPKYITENTDHPLITSKNIKNGKLILDECNYISKEDFDNINQRSQVHKNDIIMPMIGTIGNPHLIIDEPYFAIKNVALFKPKDESPKFLLHFLNSNRMKKKFEEDANGGTQKFVSLSYLRNLEIFFPPLPQQEKIVSVLDTASALVEKQKALLKKYDLFLKSKFIEMFGDPVLNPMGWEVVKLETLGKWSSGGTPTRTKPEYFKGEISWYSAGELNSLHTKNSIEKITDEALQKSSAKLFKQGTLLIGMYDTAAFKMSILSFDATTNQAIANIEHNQNLVNVYYLYYAFQQTKEEYLLSRVGVRQQNLSLSKIKNFATILPPIDLQNKFAKIVEQTESLKQKEQQKLEKLQTLYDTLMKQAFNGEIH